MDAQLAAIYGTGNYEPEQTDIEKMAAAELLVKLAEEQGVDLDQFNDQEIAEMVSDLYKSAEDETPAEEKKEEEKKEKESQFGEHEKGETKEEEKKEEEKVAEADFLGRVMAHSMVHELNEIEKQAAETARTEGGDRSSLTGLHKGLQKVRENKAFNAATHGLAGAGLGHLAGGSKGVKGALIGGGIGAGVGALRAMSAKGKRQARAELSAGEKKASADASALEQLAQQLAYEMAKEAGYIEEAPQEKQASALEQAVHNRALQICEEAGLPVEWDQ